MNKEIMHSILEKVAKNNGTDTVSVKKEIERCACYSRYTQKMSWDETVLFLSCLAVINAGYTDIYPAADS